MGDGTDERVARWVRRMAAPPHGHRVSRPVANDGGARFPLTYLRTGPRGAPPLLLIPGGPGLASVFPYRALRKRATARGLDVIMVEHRGVGLSRHDADGADLPREAVTVTRVVDDLAAVLDDAGVSQAVVYGSSYGTYLAQGFGVRHPERVAGMVLDSPMLGADDVAVVRANLRALLWDGARPDTARAAELLRRLVADGVVHNPGSAVQTVYEFAGPRVLERLLDALRRGRARRTWDWVVGLGKGEVEGSGIRFVVEPDLTGGIAYGELGFGAPPDGHPLDPQVTFAAQAQREQPFAGEPFDLRAELPRFDRPTAVISGDRDLRTPRPIAAEITSLLPDGVLVPLPDLGHSALDTHGLAALHVAHAVGSGGHRKLPALAARIGGLPRVGASRMVGPMIRARLAVDLLRR